MELLRLQYFVRNSFSQYFVPKSCLQLLKMEILHLNMLFYHVSLILLAVCIPNKDID